MVLWLRYRHIATSREFNVVMLGSYNDYANMIHMFFSTH